MKGLIRNLIGGQEARHIATVRYAGASRTISSTMPQSKAKARQRHSAALASADVADEQIFEMRPLLEMAGVSGFRIKWPTAADVLAIGFALKADGQTGGNANRTFSVLLIHLAGIESSLAQRLALAHLDAVSAMFTYAFREMRSQLPDGDPRLADILPATLARAI